MKASRGKHTSQVSGKFATAAETARAGKEDIRNKENCQNIENKMIKNP